MCFIVCIAAKQAVANIPLFVRIAAKQASHISSLKIFQLPLHVAKKTTVKKKEMWLSLVVKDFTFNTQRF
jgi:hypothetical protein